MRKKGQRGYLPSKSNPTTRRFTKVNDEEDVDSGIARPPVDVNAVMAEHFNPYDYIEPVPHGIDPFAGDETSIRTKVVFRPSKSQMGAIMNKKKHGQVIEHSGESGYAPVKHEKVFLAKNSDKDVPVWSVPTIEHQERPDTSGLQQFARPSEEHNPRQEETFVGSTNVFDYEPFFSDSGNVIHQQHRKIQSIQEVVQARIQVAQVAVLGNGGANFREMSGKARSKSAKTTAGRIDEESQGNQWGDYGQSEQPEYERLKKTISKQRPSTDMNYTAEPNDYEFDQRLPAPTSKSQQRRRVQFSQEHEESTINPEDYIEPVSPVKSSKNFRKHNQKQPVKQETIRQIDIDVYGDEIEKPKMNSRRRYNAEPTNNASEQEMTEILDPAIDDVPREQQRRRQNHPTKKQAHASIDVNSLVPTAVKSESKNKSRRNQPQSHEKSNEPLVIETSISAPSSQMDKKPQSKSSSSKDNKNEHSQKSVEAVEGKPGYQQERLKRLRKIQAEDRSVQKQQNSNIYEITSTTSINKVDKDNTNTVQRRQKQSADIQHQDAPPTSIDNVDVSANDRNNNVGNNIQRRVKQSVDDKHQVAHPTQIDDVDVRSLDRIVHAKPQRIQAEPEGVYVAQRLVVANPADRVKEALAKVRRLQNNPANEIAQPLNPESVPSKDSNPVSNRRTFSAKPDHENSNISVIAQINNSGNVTETEAMMKNKKTQTELSLDAGESFETTAKTEIEIATKQREANLVKPDELEIHSRETNPNTIDAGFDPQILEIAESKNDVARETEMASKIEISVRADQEGQKTGLETNTRSREPIIKSDINSGANRLSVFRKTNP